MAAVKQVIGDDVWFYRDVGAGYVQTAYGQSELYEGATFTIHTPIGTAESALALVATEETTNVLIALDENAIEIAKLNSSGHFFTNRLDLAQGRVRVNPTYVDLTGGSYIIDKNTTSRTIIVTNGDNTSSSTISLPPAHTEDDGLEYIVWVRDESNNFSAYVDGVDSGLVEVQHGKCKIFTFSVNFDDWLVSVF